MYCPKCGTQNESGQGYCRQCGQTLRGVKLALDGRVDALAEKFGKAKDFIGAGLLTFAIFLVLAIVSFVLGGAIPFAITVLSGVVICLPIVISGLVKLDRLRLTLETNEPGELPPTRSVEALPAAAKTDPLQPELAMPVSVTEHTTRRLSGTD